MIEDYEMDKAQHFINTTPEGMDKMYLDALEAGYLTVAESMGYAIIDQGRKLPVWEGHPKSKVIGFESNQMTPSDRRFCAREDAWLASIATIEGK